MNKLAAIVFMIFLFGCETVSKHNSLAPPDPKLVDQFDKGLRYLESEDYDQASHIFESLLVKNPTSEFELVTMYNAGASREGLGDCKGAADRYRHVVNVATAVAPQLQAQAMYRLSFAYECMGNDTKVISSLFDVKSRAQYFPEETIRAEMPARLAAAYARSGNRAQSRAYLEQANRGLTELVSTYRTKAKYNDLMGRTLFFMGRLNLPDDRAKNKPQAYLNNILALQPYLYQAVELEVPVWSEKSLNQLANAYEQVWTFVGEVQDPEKKDVLLKENSERRMRLEIAKEATKALESLKNYQTEPESAGGYLAKLTFLIDREEKKFQKLLAENSVTTLKSIESRKREGLRREGHVQ